MTGHRTLAIVRIERLVRSREVHGSRMYVQYSLVKGHHSPAGWCPDPVRMYPVPRTEL